MGGNGYDKESPGRTGRPRERLPGEPGAFAARVGDGIRSAREGRGLTIAEASARASGLVSVPAWSDYETGRHEPRLSRFLAVCLALDVEPGLLLSGWARALATCGREKGS